MTNEDSRTLFCCNLSDKVTEELLYELFLQVAPLEKVRLVIDKQGRKSSYGFVTLKHEISADYAVQMLDGTSLFDRQLTVKRRNVNHNSRAGGNNTSNFPQAPLLQQSPNFEGAQDHSMMMINNFQDLMNMGQLMQMAYSQSVDQQYRGGRQYDDGGDRGRHNRNKPYARQHGEGHHSRHNDGNSFRNNNRSRGYSDKNRRRYY